MSSSAALPLTGSASARGFTLLEMMIVAGILSVLLGLGIGFLGRGSGLSEARSAIAGQLRSAALHARMTCLPTEVRITPSENGENAVVSAHGLQPIAVWSFEPDQRQIDSAMDAILGGVELANGRYGKARTCLPGERLALLRVPLPPVVADLSSGFAIRFDLKLTTRHAGMLMSLSQGLTVEIDGDAMPRMRMKTTGGSALVIQLQAKESLPVGRWCTFEIAADGKEVWLSVDGRVLDRATCTDAILQTDSDQLEVGSSAEQVDGAFDEVQLMAYVYADRMELPSGVLPLAALRVFFDVDGNPIAPPKIELRIAAEDRTETLLVGQGGVLQ
ncbi:MAG: prepilin-type N-terminal cleavage/methylation domain-containing protein [Planctomycetes bacterium]|nr:prepilin-type N-terminal cleavage/methylation domain-containing protein [Planctomycetota bacterium]